MTLPEVSILLPYHNAENTLRDCLDSIRAQTFHNYEIIAVDDASTDGSTGLLSGCDDNRLKIIRNQGRGLVPALNLGLSQCTAPLVARMDADDIMHPERIEKQWCYMRSNQNVAVLATQAENFPRERIREGFREYMRWQNSVTSHEQISRQIYIESPFVHPTVMYRRDTIIAAGGYHDGMFPEDYELWLRLFHGGHLMEKLPEVLLKWRESDTRLSRVSPNCSRESFDRLRADYLSRDGRIQGRSIAYWGAGRRTRQRVKHLMDRGYEPAAWIDIDPRKIGNIISGARVEEPAWLQGHSISGQRYFVLNYVTNHGARDQVRNYLLNTGYRIGEDFLEVG
jgi:glycosyltransferase involved in cell wall biosynthesis